MISRLCQREIVTARLLDSVTSLSHLASRPGGSRQDGEYGSMITTKANVQVAWAGGVSLRFQPSGPSRPDAHHSSNALSEVERETASSRW